MSEYAQRREARRRSSAIRAAAVVFLLGASVALRVGWLPVSPVFVIVALLVAISYVRLKQQTRGLQRPPRRVALPTSWSSTAPLWVARNHQEADGERGEVFGRLTCAATGWTWQPTPRTRRMGAVAFQWPNAPDLDVSFSPIWGLTPMCRVTLSVGPRALDFWVRESAVDVRDALETSQQPL